MILSKTIGLIPTCWISQVQHHDGITGTESPKVADMYLQHLMQATMGVEELLAALFLLPHNRNMPSIPGSRHHRRGVSIFPR